jgi:RNA recognition motif-containing protein
VDYSASLYVSELPAPCDEEQIRTLFGVYGKLKKVELPPKKAYCFVTFETAAAAESALKAGPLSLDGVELKMAGRRPAPTYSARVNFLCAFFWCFLLFGFFFFFSTAFLFRTPFSLVFIHRHFLKV